MTRTELTKMFECNSYRDAMEFMQACAKHMDEVNHHPRWENLWKTVTVWLSTWDIGHEISDRDITLAQYFDTKWAERATKTQ